VLCLGLGSSARSLQTATADQAQQRKRSLCMVFSVANQNVGKLDLEVVDKIFFLIAEHVIQFIVFFRIRVNTCGELLLKLLTTPMAMFISDIHIHIAV
jgi:hypothetical protein